MRSHRVSIVMPVFNGADFIREAILSVQAQTTSNWELIIADDLSSDDSVAIARAFAESDNRIHVISASHRNGPAAARNRAIQFAAGRWIAFLDCDDTWHPEKLTSTLTFMRKRNLALAYTAYIRLSGSKTEFIAVPSSASLSSLLKTNFIATSTVVIDRNFVPNVVMNELVGYDDYFAWLEILRAALPVGGLDQALTTYRKSRGSVSNNKLLSARAVLLMMWRDLRLSPVEVVWYFSNYAVRGALKHFEIFRGLNRRSFGPGRPAQKPER